MLEEKNFENLLPVRKLSPLYMNLNLFWLECSMDTFVSANAPC